MCAYWCHSESSWKQFKVSKTLTNMQQTCNKHATVSPQSQLNYLSCNIFSLNESIWFKLLTLGNAKLGCLWVEGACRRSLLGNWKKINKGFSITDVSAQTSPFSQVANAALYQVLCFKAGLFSSLSQEII